MAFLLGFTLYQSAYAGSLDKTGALVVTIKPLYSLLAHLTDGITEPVLLLKQIPSAHHYNLRPSQRKLLANAKLIVWLGPQMESYLTKIIQQSADTSGISSISVLAADRLQRLPRRRPHSHHTANEERSVTEKSHNIDPHIWLSTKNAMVISRYLARSLIQFDPENREHYEKNLRLLSKKIKHTAVFLQKHSSAEPRPFIAYHDAYQYLEKELGLRFIDAISYDENAGTSLKHAREIKAAITRQHIPCLVYQPPQPALVGTLQAQTSINTIALDPLGLQLKNDKEAWFELMQHLAVNFNQCLSSHSTTTD